ncbi:hypothetical protein Emag_000582 [Eimeria magna]
MTNLSTPASHEVVFVGISLGSSSLDDFDKLGEFDGKSHKQGPAGSPLALTVAQPPPPPPPPTAPPPPQPSQLLNTSECSSSSSSSSSSSRDSSPEERPRIRRRGGCNRVSRGRREGSSVVETWEEEEEEDEATLKREAHGFVSFEDGRVFYRTYTATELIDSATKVKGRQTKVQEAPFGFIPPEADECISFSSNRGAPPTGKKRKRQPAGSRGGPPGLRGPLQFEVRWVFDARDLKQLGGYSTGEAPLGSDEFAESDRCECVPAEWLDEEALVLNDRRQYEEEIERRERIEREGGPHEHLPPLCFITHFYCSRTNMLMPIAAVDADKEKFLLNSSRFHRVYMDDQQERGACSRLRECTSASANESAVCW